MRLEKLARKRFFTILLSSAALLAGLTQHAWADEARLLVANSSGNNIVAYTQHSGRYLGELVAPGVGGLDHPDSMVIGPDGMLYVSSGVSERDSAVLRFDPNTGTFLGRFAEGNGMRRPYGITFGPDGLLYVASFRSDMILRFDGDSGAFVDVFAKGTAAPGGINGPTGMAFGPDGALYVSTQGSVATADGNISYPGLPSEVLRLDINTGKASVFIEQPDALPDGSGGVSLLGVVFGPSCNSAAAGFNSAAAGFENAAAGTCDLFVSDFLGGVRRYKRNGALKAVFSTDYTGTLPSDKSAGGLTFGGNGLLFTVAFNRKLATSPGAILRFKPTTSAPGTVTGKASPTYINETTTLKRPIGILAL